MKHWYSARRRCNDSKVHGFQYYGGKGIEFKLTKEEIKELWFRDKAYEMERPSIDREDDDGNYELNNCRFIEMSKNSSLASKKSQMKPILQFDLNGKFIKEFESILKASKLCRINQSHISTVAKGKRKTAGGFIWKYKKEKNNDKN